MEKKGRRRNLRRYTFMGKDLDELCALKEDNFRELLRSRQRRRLRRTNGFKASYLKLLEKLKESKKNIKPGEKSKAIRTHLRNCIIMPQMVGATAAVYNGKEFKEVEIKFDMIGTYLGEYSMTYLPTLRRFKGKKAKKE